MISGRSAVCVIPPVADKDFLVEDGSLGTEETVLTAVEVTVVVDLEEEDNKRY